MAVVPEALMLANGSGVGTSASASTAGGIMNTQGHSSAKHVFSANHPRAAESASQQPKHPEQVENLAFGAFDAGERSPAGTLALANIQV